MAKATFFWTLPPAGDGRPGGRTRGHEKAGGAGAATTFGSYDHLLQVARATKAAGFTGAYIPWDGGGEDSWIVASALARQVRGLTFVPSLQPGFATPVYVAKMSVSFQRLSGQRLGWALPLEGDVAVRRAHGDFLVGDAWFERADEFVTAARGVYHQTDFHFQGRHYEVEAGGFDTPLAGQRFPTVTTIGESAAAIAFAARHADVHLFASSEPHALATQRAALTDAAAKAGRDVAVGIQTSILARPTDDEAKRDLDRVRSQQGQGSADPARLVGSYDTVAATINSFVEQGISHFVLSGQPHLEEAYRFAEQIAPRLQRLSAQPRARASSSPSRVPAAAGALS